MPTYSYKARDESGKPVNGVMEAVSDSKLAEELKRMGYTPIHIEEGTTQEKQPEVSRFPQRIKTEDMILFNMQLSNMISAGLTLVHSLRIISRQLVNPKLKETVDQVVQSVSAGTTFSEALSIHPKVFSNFFVNVVKAGELSGTLSTVLKRYSTYIEQQAEIRNKIKNALFYPLILISVGAAVVSLIIIFVMPKFVAVFQEAKVPLPWPTLFLYNLGNVIKIYWYVILFAVALGVAGVKMYLKTEAGKWQFDRMLINLPVVGLLTRRIILSRFSRTLATLLESSVPLIQALDVLRDVLGNRVYAQVVSDARGNVEKGERLTSTFDESKIFPEDVTQTINVGEETGKLDVLLNKIADFYDTMIEYSMKKMVALIEPFFIIIMGVVVGFIVASMILPMFDMVKTLHR